MRKFYCSITAAVQAFGYVDILVANHAYSTMGSLEELTAAEIDKHLQANVRGTLLLVQAFAAQLMVVLAVGSSFLLLGSILTRRLKS